MRLPLLPAATCQFPLWDDERPTHVYCAAPATPGSSYCHRHHARCWTPRRLAPLPAAPPDARTWLSLAIGGTA